MNYLINYLIAVHPQLLTNQVVVDSTKMLADLKNGKVVVIKDVHLKMNINGKIDDGFKAYHKAMTRGV